MTKPLDEQAFIQHYLANPHISLVDIGKVFGRTDNTLRLVLRKHGITRTRQHFAPDFELKVVEEYKNTQSVEKTAKKFKVSTKVASKIIKKHRLEVRNGRQAKVRPDLSEAQQKLFNDHIPLVKTIIKRTGSWRAKLAGMDLDDMFSVGMIGLWRAALTYNPNKNTTFGTLAYKTIEGDIFEAIEIARFGRRRHGKDLIDHSKFVEYIEVNEND
jgi:DNA-directed RNA polymerase sigma subunit (sigma70/sigma32)